MTYFHRRTSTIIGAKAFHGPVRDGKAWDHLAMVVKRKGGAYRPRSGSLYATFWQEARRGLRVARTAWPRSHSHLHASHTRLNFFDSCP